MSDDASDSVLSEKELIEIAALDFLSQHAAHYNERRRADEDALAVPDKITLGTLRDIPFALYTRDDSIGGGVGVLLLSDFTRDSARVIDIQPDLLAAIIVEATRVLGAEGNTSPKH